MPSVAPARYASKEGAIAGEPHVAHSARSGEGNQLLPMRRDGSGLRQADRRRRGHDQRDGSVSVALPGPYACFGSVVVPVSMTGTHPS
jgi:hypothetical protein